MFRSSSSRLKDLLPWYVTGTLDAAARRAVERWAHRQPEAASELAEWQHVHAAVSTQPRHKPAPAVWQRVITQARSSPITHGQPAPLPRRAWVWGGILAVAIMLLLWGSIRPGIVLRWSADDVPLIAFRVYRTLAGSTDFELVHEVPAQADSQQYTYVDPLLVPGKTYVYRVEGIGPNSTSTFSQAVVGNATEALPSQLAILLTGLVGGYGIVSLAHQLRVNGGRRLNLRLMVM